ncbi:type II 3-dehydroquinate dehydratase [uncultured Thalassospira sp.]|jgi:3-dehydroquinate dehydratase-2|uniref:type II 3-dehydroquinate dehydratase n=1 Tax=uncultured Thalassospira sp. TaxID=404382 RepID=UPI0030DC7FF0|tara:strand:+ start:14408 stop:14854 length:447 start_codon:yes stop_codon:yes gene_type:complete
MTKPVYILNGPNLNLLGQRQPEIYGATTLEDIRVLCEQHAASIGLQTAFHQSNHEGVLVDQIQEARVKGCGIILNAAAYTHTSVAILDALLASDLPIVEVHLSNIHQRDTFRHHSFVSKAAKGMICGFGAQGYVLALDALKPLIAPSS